MPMTPPLLRGLPRTKVLATSLLQCQQQQSVLGSSTHRCAQGWPARMWQSPQCSRNYQTTSALCSYILTPPQVNSILKANEYSFKVCGLVHVHRDPVQLGAHMLFVQVPEFDGKNVSSVMGFESNQLPANAPIEDRRSAATCLQTRGMLLGVFDGHAGCACAQVKMLFHTVFSRIQHQGLICLPLQ